MEHISTPIYIVEEAKLRRNLSHISNLAARAEVEFILAFKAFALWKTFPVFKEYIQATTASSLAEAMLAKKEFGSPAHTFSPAYMEDEIDRIADCSSHITFNSLSQYERFHERVAGRCSIGLRINPQYSEIQTMLYNPCAPGSRFGVTADKLPDRLPDDIDGFHCHCHCESGADEFQRTLAHIEQKFSKWFGKLKWVNFGGGHLVTRAGYDTELFVRMMREFHQRYPHLHVVFEPGSAFAWQTGPLVAHVVDIVEDSGISTAILDVSFTCHMPDCLEMPYFPEVRGAEHVDESPEVYATGGYVYRLGGNSCLSGDFMSCWRFDSPLQVGQEIVFEDMIHYTTVKTSMFNGIGHPAIGMLHSDGRLEILRQYTYDDYKNRMD